MASSAPASRWSATWLLWSRFTLRHARAAPRQSALLVMILAIGVAVHLSIRLANRAAIAGFEHLTEVVTGRSDFILQPAAGSIDDAALGEIRRTLGAEPVELVPVVEVNAVRPRSAQAGSGVDDATAREAFRVVGLDLVAARNLLAAGQMPSTGASGGPSAGPGVWITQALARRDGLTTGSELSLIINDTVATLEIAGVLPEIEGRPAPPLTLLIVDLPDLQRLAHRPGRIDRIEVILADGPNLASRRKTVAAMLSSGAGGRWEIATPDSRRETGEIMTAAFRLNLTVLSLIALLVGLILILQALDGAVVRRRQEIAILRSLGVEERQIQTSWLIEAATLGTVGGVLGALLGWAGAQGAVRLVGRTVNQLYYANTVDSAALHPSDFLTAVFVGLVASVVAGWLPAKAAAATPPAQMLARTHIATGLAFLRRRWPGVFFLFLGGVLSLLPPLRLAGDVQFPLAGFLAALCWIIGGSLAGPALFRPIAALAQKAARRRPTLALALTHLRHATGRHRLAAAGLITATGMTAGMIVLVSSFEYTLRGWIDRSLRADLFVASDGAQNASSISRLSEQTWRPIAADAELAGVELFQGYAVTIDGKPTFLGGHEYRGDVPRKDIPWARRPAIAPENLQFHPDAAYASESFTERFRVDVGSTITVPTPSGARTLEISGIFADYGSDRGSLLVSRQRLVAWFGEDALVNMALYAGPGSDIDEIRRRILDQHPGLRVMPNADLRRRILTIFRQTFSITYALEIIGVVVAVAGLALMLASMLIDRRDQLTTLRALGLTHREIATVAAWEGCATALTGLLAGLALSLVLGCLLVFVINKQSFGWTLQFVVPVAPLLFLSLAVLVSAAAASWVVGLRGAALPADREE